MSHQRAVVAGRGLRGRPQPEGRRSRPPAPRPSSVRAFPIAEANAEGLSAARPERRTPGAAPGPGCPSPVRPGGPRGRRSWWAGRVRGVRSSVSDLPVPVGNLQGVGGDREGAARTDVPKEVAVLVRFQPERLLDEPASGLVGGGSGTAVLGDGGMVGGACADPPDGAVRGPEALRRSSGHRAVSRSRRHRAGGGTGRGPEPSPAPRRNLGSDSCAPMGVHLTSLQHRSASTAHRAAVVGCPLSAQPVPVTTPQPTGHRRVSRCATKG